MEACAIEDIAQHNLAIAKYHITLLETYLLQGKMVPRARVRTMPNRLLRDRELNRNDVERLNVAFNLALRGLHLVDRNDPICEIVGRKVIEIGTDGVLDPKEIANRVTRQLRPL